MLGLRRVTSDEPQVTNVEVYEIFARASKRDK
jgi:hypothetical protein